MRIGEQVKVDLYLSYTANKNIKVQWPSIGDTITEKVEVISVSAIDTTFPDKSNSTKILQHQQITVSVYDSGYYAIPGFKFIVNEDTANPLYTRPLFLEVHTVPTDSSATKTKDIKPPFTEPFNWKWYIGYIYGGIAVLVIILLTVLITMYYARKRKNAFIEPAKPKIPAHIIALAALERIREESVWKDGKVKEYYSAISDTIRLYIEERFHVFALESTTDEIMTAFRSLVIDRESKERLQQLLTLSDLVKFAKQTPIENEHFFTLQNAFDFVNGTKREDEVYEAGEMPSHPSSPVTVPEPIIATPQNSWSNSEIGNDSSPKRTSESIINHRTEKPIPQKKNPLKTTLIVVAVILGFLLLFFATYYVVNGLVTPKAFTSQHEEDNTQSQAGTASENMIARTALDLNRQCPMMVDSETRLDSASVVSDKTLRIYITMVNVSQGQLDVPTFESQSRPAMVSMMKVSPEFKPIRDQAGTLEYEYRYNNGSQICTITISPEDYLN